MSRPVVPAGPETSFKELVALLAEHAIAASTVVDEHRHPIGVVDEADLLARHGRDARQERGARWLRVWSKAQGLTARELMTRRVPTVAKDEPLVAAARRLVETNLRCLYVVNGAGHLVGVLARRDARGRSCVRTRRSRRPSNARSCSGRSGRVPAEVASPAGTRGSGGYSERPMSSTSSTVRVA
nr:CBS domain-containing protein [Amycolatopsis balhimycina]